MSDKKGKNSIRMRLYDGGWDEWVFKMLITHPMEAGMRKDARNGQIIPADYIALLQIDIDSRPQIEFRLSDSVSRDPYFSFSLATPPRQGQTMKIRWLDNHQQETVYEFVLNTLDTGVFDFTHEVPGAVVKPLTPAPKPLCDNIKPKK